MIKKPKRIEDVEVRFKGGATGYPKRYQSVRNRRILEVDVDENWLRISSYCPYGGTATHEIFAMDGIESFRVDCEVEKPS